MRRFLLFIVFVLACVVARTMVMCYYHPGHYTTNITQPVQFFRGVDGYVFERKQFENTDLHIKIVSHPNLTSLWASMGEKHNNPTDNVTLAYTMEDGYGNCTIHIVDQSVVYTPDLLGHELAHCMYGEFHPHQKVAVFDGS